MKRLHVHVAVEDLEKSRAFYSTMFAAEPSVVETDYVKWMLEDPRVNFAISRRGHVSGIDHLGIQVETAEELAGIAARLKAAEQVTVSETNAACCYVRSDKEWAIDPSGIRWESFLTHGPITTYGEGAATEVKAEPTASACCAPPKIAAPNPAASSCCA